MARASDQTNEMLTHSPQPDREFDLPPPIMWSMALIGLAAMGVALWFVSMQTRPVGSVPPVRPALAINTRATRDAHQAAIEAYQGANEILRTELVDVKAELGRTQAELAQAEQRVASNEQSGVDLGHPPLALILDVPLLEQEHSLSCEAAAATMAARYHRLRVGESDILRALPLHENPHLGFRGNVDGPYGGLVDYGVYAAPIRQVLTELGLQVEPLTGGIDEIKAHIRKDRPVLAWITYDLQVETPEEWLLPGKDNQPEPVTLVPHEHTVLIVGYNGEGLWVNDPFDGTRNFYPESEFGRSFGYLGEMALVIGPPAQ